MTKGISPKLILAIETRNKSANLPPEIQGGGVSRSGDSVGNSDVLANSDVWQRDRPRGVARDWEIQGQKHVAHMLQACGLGSSQEERDDIHLFRGVPIRTRL